MTPAALGSTGRGAGRGLALVVAVQATVLLVLAPHYGPHRDELYFASAGHRLAWGYPDQPALTALLARLADVVAPHSVLALRVPSVAAAVGLTLLTAWFARALGTRSASTLWGATTSASRASSAVRAGWSG